MRIKQIEVTNLFGIFHHTVSLHLSERITIIHGPNGFGKTTLLHMVHYLFCAAYNELAKIPFDSFIVTLEDNSELTVKRTETEMKKGTRVFKYPSLVLTGVVGGQPFDPPAYLVLPPDERESTKIHGSSKASSYRWYRRTASGIVMDDPHDDPERIPKWWRNLRRQVTVVSVETQRLSRKKKPQNDPHTTIHSQDEEEVAAVKYYASDLVNRIKEKLEKLGEVGQELDRTYPTRLMEGTDVRELTDEDIRIKLRELEEKRRRIGLAGLLEKHQENMPFPSPPNISDKTRAALSVYVQDFEKKLAVYDGFLERVEMFRRILNDLFTYKTVVIDKTHGFFIRTKTAGHWPDQLSSGEQHEIVLLYELLFKVKEGTLILIDEPELSLHVEWQRMFLDNIQQIATNNGFDVLIATHSPQIINDRTDLMVPLIGPPL